MPRRTAPMITDSIYHVFNRGVGKSVIFKEANDYTHFLTLMKYYRVIDYPYSIFKQLLEKRPPEITVEEFKSAFVRNHSITPPVSILAFCLMPNHYHLILQQETDNGIEFYMHKLGTSYALYFNKKYSRSGALFESRFKHVSVLNSEQLGYLSRYIHRNPVKLGIPNQNLANYKYSSFSLYLNDNLGEPTWLNKTSIMRSFNNNTTAYKQYITRDYLEDEVEHLETISIDDDFSWYNSLVKRRALN